MMIHTRLWLSLLCIGMTLACAAHAEVTDTTDDDTSPDWTLTWSDEFEGPEVDPAKWEVLTRDDNYNNEKQYYLPEQATIIDGMLRIAATNTPHKDKAYRSARLESWFTQAYGRFEVRAKIPTSKGIWPAIWLLPRSGNWPHDGEIDIMEHAGSHTERINAAVHFADEHGQHDHVSYPHTTTDKDDQPIHWPDRFHIYSTEWSPTRIVFFVDDVEFYRVGRDQIPPIDTPMAVVLNTAVGGDYDGDPDDSTVFPLHFDIDYVRVYKWTGGYDSAVQSP